MFFGDHAARAANPSAIIAGPHRSGGEDLTDSRLSHIGFERLRIL
ncbi:hypothetical protein USDA257_c03590 [Sinorhizobium fredii USDA 257]|jgi:hypothetical protein|uniref:Uncharacterized protein n=1 Tax=Sinorhizobium fredii (strain USDA 257) TaxID=1185652 RepID=I3WZA1_SINF2|nr:hypothetical protein USDA257_c03590 [Sinorhizobium fredii USDA 257]